MIINGEVVSTILRGPQEMKKPVFIKRKKKSGGKKPKYWQADNSLARFW